SPEYEQKMADLGSVRHGLLLAGRAKTEEERARWMRKVRAYGYQLRPREEPVTAAEVQVQPAPPQVKAPPAMAEEDDDAAERRAAQAEKEELLRAARERLQNKGTAARIFGAIISAAVAAGFAFVAAFALYTRYV